MSKETILAIDDESSLLELLKVNLEKEGYNVICTTRADEGLRIIRQHLPRLILLDLMMPESDGFEICREIKSSPLTAHIPVIILTARGEEADIVAGLEMGADDYITKPFSPRVLRSRVKAVLRRRKVPSSEIQEPLHIHNLYIHPGRHEVSIDDQLVTLTPTEFRVLYFLAQQPGWVFTRYQIVDGVKGADCAVTDRSVDVQIVALRRKLGPAGDYIETVRGVGYRFRE